MIHANQITRRTSGRELFTDVSFFLPAGSYTRLAGNSGSGKTVLLTMIAGLQRPDSGKLVVSGVDMLHVTADHLPHIRREIGFVQSATPLLENRNTAENVRMPLDIAGFDRRAANERVEQIMEELGLTVIADIPVQRLSNDQRWLVACARATVHKPAVVLVDEPAGISHSALHRQWEMENRLVKDGATVLSAGPESGSRHLTFRLELQQGRSLLDGYTAVSH